MPLKFLTLNHDFLLYKKTVCHPERSRSLRRRGLPSGANRGATATKGSRNESCWLVTGMLLFVLQGCKITVGKLLVIHNRSLRRRCRLDFLRSASLVCANFDYAQDDRQTHYKDWNRGIKLKALAVETARNGSAARRRRRDLLRMTNSFPMVNLHPCKTRM